MVGVMGQRNLTQAAAMLSFPVNYWILGYMCKKIWNVARGVVCTTQSRQWTWLSLFAGLGWSFTPSGFSRCGKMGFLSCLPFHLYPDPGNFFPFSTFAHAESLTFYFFLFSALHFLVSYFWEPLTSPKHEKVKKRLGVFIPLYIIVWLFWFCNFEFADDSYGISEKIHMFFFSR